MAESERHPLEPFLPEDAETLMLGSFPPQRVRWCMDFYYPNFQNDMWRIMGYIETGDANAFVDTANRRFDLEKVVDFCRRRRLALYDTATEVVRLRNNASDNFLEVVRPTDVAALLARLPHCRRIVATGKKSADTLREMIGFDEIGVGGSTEVTIEGRRYSVYRTPSTSRAYPRPIAWKAEYYRKVIGSGASLRG